MSEKVGMLFAIGKIDDVNRPTTISYMVFRKPTWVNRFGTYIILIGCLLSVAQVAMAQAPNVSDGHFCDGGAWGPPVGIDNCNRDATGAAQRCPDYDQEQPGPPATGDVEKLWMKQVDNMLYVAWGRVVNGSGTSIV